MLRNDFNDCFIHFRLASGWFIFSNQHIVWFRMHDTTSLGSTFARQFMSYHILGIKDFALIHFTIPWTRIWTQRHSEALVAEVTSSRVSPLEMDVLYDVSNPLHTLRKHRLFLSAGGTPWLNLNKDFLWQIFNGSSLQAFSFQLGLTSTKFSVASLVVAHINIIVQVKIVRKGCHVSSWVSSELVFILEHEGLLRLLRKYILITLTAWTTFLHTEQKLRLLDSFGTYDTHETQDLCLMEEVSSVVNKEISVYKRRKFSCERINKEPWSSNRGGGYAIRREC